VSYILKEKEQKILDASLNLFVDKGFHGTSTAKIAENAGVATGTLFHYFKTKEELINCLYLSTKESMLNEINDNYDNKKDIKENLKNLWLKSVKFCTKNPQKFQFILIFQYSPYITSLTKKQIETQTECMIETYIKGIEKHEIKEISFEFAMDYFWGNITSTVNYFRKHPEELNENTLDQVFELFWDGIST
jgi:AcrR family transcriptional regulator